MGSYGIKISRPGFDVRTAAPHELAFSSKYKTLKIHDTGSGTLTHSSRTVTIPHGLGYVPFFLVHTQLDPAIALASEVGDSSDYFISPFRIGSAIDIYEAENTHDIIAWADSTNLYVKAKTNVGRDIYPIWTAAGPSANEVIAWDNSFGYATGQWAIGRLDPTFGAMKAAFRTSGGVSLAKSESIHAASMNIYVEEKAGNGEVKTTVTGADVDNVSPFNSVNAFSNPRTTASVTSNSTLTDGDTLGINVKSIIEEIIGRSGWSSGNHIAIIVEDNGTADGDFYSDLDPVDSRSNLEIIRSNSLASFKYTIFLNQLE